MSEIKMMKSIKDYVSNLYNLDIEKDTRKREYVDARALYYKLCRDLTKCSLTTIGESVGRDHSGVLHSLKNILHHLDIEEIEKGYVHFGKVENLPKESYSYLEYKNGELVKELKKKKAILRLLPKLETIYNNLNELTEEQKQIVNRRNEMQFDTIARCLNRVEEIIETETVIE
jgi:hypothetical protein